jgi:hypothetical protein
LMPQHVSCVASLPPDVLKVPTLCLL